MIIKELKINSIHDIPSDCLQIWHPNFDIFSHEEIATMIDRHTVLMYNNWTLVRSLKTLYLTN